jgi:hypothetical protein
MNESRMNYTAAHVTEDVAAGTGAQALAWTPIVKGSIVEGGVAYDVKLVKAGASDVFGFYNPADKKFYSDAGFTSQINVAADTKVAYVYDNVVIPQNDIPQLTASLEGIELAAKARRIGIYYSQLAAFQAKTEMGVDLGEILATQACAELSYEIDTEVVNLLVKNATVHADLAWNKRLPVGVSKRDHYAGFAEVIELASQHIYDATKKHAANYMIASSSIKPVLSLMEGWKAASSAKINGPYFAGEINGIKVYISPAISAGKFVLGYNGGDMLTSAAVYAPYMAIIPTQLLGFSDGAMSQGFSTLYDLKMLNPALLVAGEVKDVALDPLVVGGEITTAEPAE